MPFPIETERLTVRRFGPDDLEAIVAFTAHPSVSRETTNIPRDDPVKLDEYAIRQSKIELFEAKACVDLAIERKADRCVLGLLSLVSDGNRQGEIGWALGIEHRRQGYATEAARGLLNYVFTECGYHRIFAGTIYTNERSWGLMERLGMRKEAHFREAHVPAEPGGPWIDTVRYAILASEWTAMMDTKDGKDR